MKCYCNFNSQYCIFNNNELHINDYGQQIHKNNIKCCHNHDLKYTSETSKTISYFSHINTDNCATNNTSKWHTEWQDRQYILDKYCDLDTFNEKINTFSEKAIDKYFNVNYESDADY